MIRKIETFVDEETGFCVNAATPLSEPQGDFGKPVLLSAVIYSATTQISVNTQHGPQMTAFEFAFPVGYTLPQCFKEFKQIAESSFKKYVEEMKEKQSGLILPPEKQVII